MLILKMRKMQYGGNKFSVSNKKSLAEPQREPRYIALSLNYDIILFHKVFFLPKVSQSELKGKMLFHLISTAEVSPFLLSHEMGSSSAYKARENYADCPVLCI